MRGQDPGPSHSSGDMVAVHGLAEALRQAVNGADVDGIVACWAADGILLPPRHAVVQGTSAIREYFSDVFATRRLAFTFTEFSIEVAGDVAIERLHYTATATTPDGQTAEDVGKGLHICTRRADGTWQLAYDIWNSDRSMDAASRRV